MKYCKCAFAITSLALYLCYSTANAEAPMISLQKGGYSLLLSEAMKKVLKDYNTTFAVWQSRDYLPSLVRLYPFSTCQAPSAVIGDFNGDGTLDAVLEGHNETHGVLVCVLSSAEGFKIIELGKSEKADPKQSRYDDERGLWVYLTLVPPGKITSPHEQNP